MNVIQDPQVALPLALTLPRSGPISIAVAHRVGWHHLWLRNQPYKTLIQQHLGHGLSMLSMLSKGCVKRH
jgi:hypothetical protein